jgi:GNAT superfamily N-acetyltransferase
MRGIRRLVRGDMGEGASDKGFDLRIRPAGPGDEREMMAVYRSAYKGLEEYAYTEPMDIKRYIEWLRKGDPDGLMVAELNGKIVGFAGVHLGWHDKRIGMTAELHELVVAEEWKGKGIGKALMMAVLSYARSHGYSRVSLWVGEGNTYAQQWYKGFGFVELGRAYGWIRMVLSLDMGSATML